MFRAVLCPSSGESIVSMRYMVYVTLCRWPSGFSGWNLHTRRSSTQRDIYHISHWYNWFSWWWAQDCPKHVENRNKYTRKRTVRQVGYLQRLYPDARSTENNLLEGTTPFPLDCISCWREQQECPCSFISVLPNCMSADQFSWKSRDTLRHHSVSTVPTALGLFCDLRKEQAVLFKNSMWILQTVANTYGRELRGWIQNFPDWRCKNHKTFYKSYRPPSPSK